MATVKPDQIVWRAWSADAFSDAQTSDRPILLSINAVWCYWCHVMADSTYVDADVVQFINQNFIPIQVDTDHRPDINARYNVGGWPTTSFLTPHGGYIAGATYLPPDQFLAMLDEVSRAYAGQKPEMYEQGNDILRQRREHVARVSAGHEPDASIVDSITRRAAGAYDAAHGGFGVEPKFPSTPMLRLLLHQYRTSGEPFFRAMLEKTLDAITGSELYDDVDGGFFRFATYANWTQPQHEKMAEDNIALAGVLLDAAIILQRPDYQRVASRSIDYLVGTLYDSVVAGIRGSQGAHSEYFGLPAHQRQTQSAPEVDPYCYSSITGQAVSLFLSAAWKSGRPELSEIAFSCLDQLVETARSGWLPHTFTPSKTNQPQEGDLLVDWVHYLLAAMDGYDAAAIDGGRYLDAAEAAASVLLDRFLDASRGGFCDIEDLGERPGYLRVREKPLAENVAAATGLLRLHHATNADRYRQAAHHTLSAYVEAHRDYGELAADYAIAVDRYLNPVVEVTIEGRPGSPDADAMLTAAMALDNPSLLIKLVTNERTDVPAQAHVCLDTVCYPPVSDPAALADAIVNGGVATDSPFQNILDLLS